MNAMPERPPRTENRASAGDRREHVRHRRGAAMRCPSERHPGGPVSQVEAAVDSDRCLAIDRAIDRMGLRPDVQCVTRD